MVHRPRRAALGMRDADEEADATPPAGRGGRRRSLVQQLSGSPMSWGRSTKGERGRGGGTSSEGGESPVSPPSAFGTEDEEAVVACATPTPMGGKRYGERAGDPADPDVVFYGDELRLWAVSEYAVAKQATATRGGEAARKAEGDLGGYVGVYFKGRKRKARTGQQPLACVPPIGAGAPGDFVEAAFRVCDPRGMKGEQHAVKIGDEVLLVDRDNHVWNTSTAGVVGYLAPRLRGERRGRDATSLQRVFFRSNARETRMARFEVAPRDGAKTSGKRPRYEPGKVGNTVSHPFPRAQASAARRASSSPATSPSSSGASTTPGRARPSTTTSPRARPRRRSATATRSGS